MRNGRPCPLRPFLADLLFPHLFMKSSPHVRLALCAALTLLSLPVFADTLPDPATIKDVPPIAFVQARIYQRLDLADFTLTGTIRSDKNKTSYPITLLTKGHEMVYEFQN